MTAEQRQIFHRNFMDITPYLDAKRRIYALQAKLVTGLQALGH